MRSGSALILLIIPASFRLKTPNDQPPALLLGEHPGLPPPDPLYPPYLPPSPSRAPALGTAPIRPLRWTAPPVHSPTAQSLKAETQSSPRISPPAPISRSRPVSRPPHPAPQPPPIPPRRPPAALGTQPSIRLDCKPLPGTQRILLVQSSIPAGPGNGAAEPRRDIPHGIGRGLCPGWAGPDPCGCMRPPLATRLHVAFHFFRLRALF